MGRDDGAPRHDRETPVVAMNQPAQHDSGVPAAPQAIPVGGVSTYVQAGAQYGTPPYAAPICVSADLLLRSEDVRRLGIATGQGHAAMI